MMIQCRLFALATIALAETAFAGDVGRTVYQSVCIACHAPQNVMVSSPKAGNAADWSKRLAQAQNGIETLTDHAVEGFGAMPKKGGSAELSRDQIREAIKYMMAAPTTVAG
jgi:cytochrome c5